jgi:hypothetical protein
VVYLSYVATVLVTVQAWRMTPEQFASLAPIWWSPLAIVPAVIAREVPVWFGAWIARRGARVKAQNAEDRFAYEQALAGRAPVTGPVPVAEPAPATVASEPAGPETTD